MGFSVSYTSTRTVTPEEWETIAKAASELSEDRTWLSCEPVYFYESDKQNLCGSSKPNFMPDPDDIASAQSEGLPDGTIKDLLDILCQLSRDHEVDWKIGHDHEECIGYIRHGVCDENIEIQIEAFRDVSQMMLDMGIEGFDPEEMGL
jgi:hypothetical protein